MKNTPYYPFCLILIIKLLTGSAAYAQERILFIGNSFTFQGPVPEIVRALAIAEGESAPEVHYLDGVDAVGGKSLMWHATNPKTLELIAQRWDHVVLQEFSTRPTDNIGNPFLFKESATRLFDLVKAYSPDATVFFYETWARHQDHSYYQEPKQFDSPQQMQSQLRAHYKDVVDNYIPTNTTTTGVDNDLLMIPVGDAWESHYSSSNINIHAGDLYHANTNGRYLNALVIYAKIFNIDPVGLASQLSFIDKRGQSYYYNIDDATALQLQQAAKQALDGSPIDPIPVNNEFAKDEVIQIDFGSSGRMAEGNVNNVTDTTVGTVVLQQTVEGRNTAIEVVISDAFSGVNTYGLANNLLSYSASVSRDSFWVGSHRNHLEGLSRSGQVTIRNLNPDHSYDVTVFASRSGDDNGRGRLTRYTIEQTAQDLRVADNQDRQVEFVAVKPALDGTITLDVAVSPEGNSRYAYLGFMQIKSNGSLGLPRDTTSPQISLNTISLSGSVMDNDAVQSVTWSCINGCVSRGQANVQNNTWQSGPILMNVNSHRVRIESSDITGNRSTVTLSVVR